MSVWNIYIILSNIAPVDGVELDKELLEVGTTTMQGGRRVVGLLLQR